MLQCCEAAARTTETGLQLVDLTGSHTTKRNRVPTVRVLTVNPAVAIVVNVVKAFHPRLCADIVGATSVAAGSAVLVHEILI